MRRLFAAIDRRDVVTGCALLLIGAGLWFVSVAAALAVPGALLFLLAVPAATLVGRRGGP